MKWTNLLLLVPLVALLPLIGGAQERKRGSRRVDDLTDSNVRLKVDQAHLFLSFVAVRSLEPVHPGESGYRVFLQLNNNSKWKIFVCGGSVSSPDYGRFDAMFEVERVSGSGPVPKSWWSDACSLNTIRSGGSIVLSIPIEYLADGLAIRIRYFYQWEFEKNGFLNPNEPRHHLYFSSSLIPTDELPTATLRAP